MQWVNKARVPLLFPLRDVGYQSQKQAKYHNTLDSSLQKQEASFRLCLSDESTARIDGSMAESPPSNKDTQSFFHQDTQRDSEGKRLSKKAC